MNELHVYVEPVPLLSPRSAELRPWPRSELKKPKERGPLQQRLELLQLKRRLKKPDSAL